MSRCRRTRSGVSKSEGCTGPSDLRPPLVTSLVCQLLGIYLLVLVVRAILSWFPLSPGSAIAPVAHFLYTITEPVLAPLRRVIPAVGGFDLSFIVLFFIIQTVPSSLCGAGGII